MLQALWLRREASVHAQVCTHSLWCPVTVLCAAPWEPRSPETYLAFLTVGAGSSC